LWIISGLHVIRQYNRGGGFRVSPVMDDIHQQVGIRVWHRISEEISTHYRELTWGGGDFSDYVRLIEQNPLCFGRALENGAEQVAASAADVRDSCKWVWA
jgi:hypothetical protein